MYFWKIKNLKDDIRHARVSSRDYFYYFCAYTTVYSIFLILAVIQLYKTIGIVMAIVQIFIFMGGTFYAFYSNGARQGRDFMRRFFSIGWVFLLRATFFMSIGMLNLYVISYLFGIERLYSLQNSAIIALIFEILFYWRIGRHIADLSYNNPKITRIKNGQNKDRCHNHK